MKKVTLIASKAELLKKCLQEIMSNYPEEETQKVKYAIEKVGFTYDVSSLMFFRDWIASYSNNELEKKVIELLNEELFYLVKIEKNR